MPSSDGPAWFNGLRRAANRPARSRWAGHVRPDERAPVGERRPRVVADELGRRPDVAGRQGERGAVIAPAAARPEALLLVAREAVLGLEAVADDLHAGGQAPPADAGLGGRWVVPIAHQ